MNDRTREMTRKGLKGWALLFMTMWVLSRALSRGILGNVSGTELAAVLDSSPYKMYQAAMILILEAVSACGIVLYSALTLEGMRHTHDRKSYLLRVGILAVISEIPYDYLMEGSFWNPGAQNPAFGILICQILIYFLNLQEGKGTKPFFIRLAVVLASAAWCYILRIEYGMSLILSTVVLWIFRNHPEKRGIAGMLAGALNILLSPFFLAAPMGAMVLHFYHGEDWQRKNTGSYLAYPVILILGSLLAAWI